ncbi:ribose 1,5-bisphosphokinase [Pseudochelatococcus lubricantis]|uniref:Ribose 1,5-bisphosphate phosphokinase PhnN n=1 Tax=Pseudochelatococcus lubricantis TaxID=1538102 RepID=A0ABX0V319_9HYPH|nr:phosphonate metabolism protein/1,5-bisphosphokinase (PRPP-forming) PhnN [Pseudochelatococcus lubricantis]NIJ58494.1 ribose 1,5-bisphosphokinase [Pseudochelatococcus lubricantis]
MTNLTTGAFVCIVGPSGAGKDSLLAKARAGLADDADVVFPRRLVTRASNDSEDHDTITQAAFDEGVRDGAFALHWQAHGLSYALPLSVAEAIAGGKVAVCNVSRAVVPQVFDLFEHVFVVLITAPPAIITERLRKRGRESSASIAARLERNRKLSAVLMPDLTIMNTGPVEIGGERLVSFLRRAVERTKAAKADV